jgi:hypothetical protein
MRQDKAPEGRHSLVVGYGASYLWSSQTLKRSRILGGFSPTTPDFWLNLQSEFDLQVVRSQKEATVKSQVRPLDDSAWASEPS